MEKLKAILASEFGPQKKNSIYWWTMKFRSIWLFSQFICKWLNITIAKGKSWFFYKIVMEFYKSLNKLLFCCHLSMHYTNNIWLDSSSIAASKLKMQVKDMLADAATVQWHTDHISTLNAPLALRHFFSCLL